MCCILKVTVCAPQEVQTAKTIVKIHGSFFRDVGQQVAELNPVFIMQISNGSIIPIE